MTLPGAPRPEKLSLSERFRRKVMPLIQPVSLDVLLADANPSDLLSERVEWVHRIVQWLRSPVTSEVTDAEGKNLKSRKGKKSSRIQTVRLKYFFQLLNRNPKWRSNVAGVLRSILFEASAVDLFSATGLSREFGFFSEASNRIQRNLLPAPADDTDLSSLFNRIFLDESDPDWIDTLPEEVLRQFVELVKHDSPEPEKVFEKLRHSLVDALLILAPTIASIGLSHEMRSRMDDRSISNSPFRSLNESLVSIASDFRGGYESPLTMELAALVTSDIYSCHERIADVYAHLEESGVSVALVFKIERLTASLNRAQTLINILSPPSDAKELVLVQRFCGYLIRQSLESRKIGALIGTNLDLLSRKVVERVGLAGGHYITATGAEYWRMLKSGGGGGIVTVLTTVLKFAIASLRLPMFFEGFFQWLNFTGSFLLMQGMHFSLATKQPSMTASALANKLKTLSHRRQLDEFVDEVTRITRSQFAAAAGNIGLVIPAALFFDLALKLVVGLPVLSPVYAQKIVESFNPFTTITVPAAALTGVILWVSAVIGGWLENWAVFRKLPEAIGSHRRLRSMFGEKRTLSFADTFSRNIAGVGTNVAIGFFLVFTPILGQFFGLPLDIRHVTLSSGSLTFAMSSLGWENVSAFDFTMACIGIVLILIMNFGVSFALALFVALRARRIKSAWVYHLLLGVGRRFRTNGLQFFIPRPLKNKSSE